VRLSFWDDLIVPVEELRKNQGGEEGSSIERERLNKQYVTTDYRLDEKYVSTASSTTDVITNRKSDVLNSTDDEFAVKSLEVVRDFSADLYNKCDSSKPVVKNSGRYTAIGDAERQQAKTFVIHPQHEISHRENICTIQVKPKGVVFETSLKLIEAGKESFEADQDTVKTVFAPVEAEWFETAIRPNIASTELHQPNICEIEVKIKPSSLLDEASTNSHERNSGLNEDKGSVHTLVPEEIHCETELRVCKQVFTDVKSIESCSSSENKEKLPILAYLGIPLNIRKVTNALDYPGEKSSQKQSEEDAAIDIKQEPPKLTSNNCSSEVIEFNSISETEKQKTDSTIADNEQLSTLTDIPQDCHMEGVAVENTKDIYSSSNSTMEDNLMSHTMTSSCSSDLKTNTAEETTTCQREDDYLLGATTDDIRQQSRLPCFGDKALDFVNKYQTSTPSDMHSLWSNSLPRSRTKPTTLNVSQLPEQSITGTLSISPSYSESRRRGSLCSEGDLMTRRLSRGSLSGSTATLNQSGHSSRRRESLLDTLEKRRRESVSSRLKCLQVCLNNDNNNEKLVLHTSHKCRCKLSSAHLSATVSLGTKQMCLQHTLETQQRD